MSTPSNSISPNIIREIMPPGRFSANLRQATFATFKARLHERVNAPDPTRGSIRANPRIDVFAYQPSGLEAGRDLCANRRATAARQDPMYQTAHLPPATPADQNPIHQFPTRPNPPSRADRARAARLPAAANGRMIRPGGTHHAV